MGIWDRLTGKKGLTPGYSEVDVEFTEEEVAFVERHLSLFCKAPDGCSVIATNKVRNGLISQGLRYYAEQLIEEAERIPNDPRSIQVLDKAIRAMMKAYACHNLPIQLYNIAGMFEMVGKDEDAKRFYGLFLREWFSFKPDVADQIMQQEIHIDTDQAILRARRRIAEL
jgi:hypothetical protein